MYVLLSTETLGLNLSGFDNPFAYNGTWFSLLFIRKFLKGDWRNLQLQVKPIH